MRVLFPSRGLYHCTACEHYMLLTTSGAAVASVARLGIVQAPPSPLAHPTT
jgi:hypothetical protein